MSFTFDEESHTYTLDGRVIPSVSELLPKKDFSFVSEETLDNAIHDGIRKHRLLEDFFKLKTNGSLTEEEEMFVGQIRLCFEVENANRWGQVKAVEQPLFSRTRLYAGTPDLAFADGIFDLKRTLGDKKLHALQLAAYSVLLRENGICDTKNWFILTATEYKYTLTNVYNPQAERIFLGRAQNYWNDAALKNYLNTL
jgi:hypothetical protein